MNDKVQNRELPPKTASRVCERGNGYRVKLKRVSK